LQFLRTLVQGGADPSQTWDRGLTPLLQAVKAEHHAKATVACLLDLGARINATDAYGNTALSLAIQRESFEVR
jgi:ankyrin repeat protein